MLHFLKTFLFHLNQSVNIFLVKGEERMYSGLLNAKCDIKKELNEK